MNRRLPTAGGSVDLWLDGLLERLPAQSPFVSRTAVTPYIWLVWSQKLLGKLVAKAEFLAK
jgi:hypothetical protein